MTTQHQRHTDITQTRYNINKEGSGTQCDVALNNKVFFIKNRSVCMREGLTSTFPKYHNIRGRISA